MEGPIDEINIRKKSDRSIEVVLTESELSFLVRAGSALTQHIPAKSLPTYTGFTKEEIWEFSRKIRKIMGGNDFSM